MRVEKQTQERTSTAERPLIDVLDQERAVHSPQSRLPRNSFISNAIDMKQLDPGYKESRKQETESYRRDLQQQMEDMKIRGKEEHERLFNNDVPLTPATPASASSGRRRRTPMEDGEVDGKKIMNEERISKHYQAITRDSTPLGDRLGKEKQEAIHLRPTTEEDKRKSQLQRERLSLLDELRRERESLQARLKQEEHALNQMEANNYPFYQESTHQGPIKYVSTLNVSYWSCRVVCDTDVPS